MYFDKKKAEIEDKYLERLRKMDLEIERLERGRLER